MAKVAGIRTYEFELRGLTPLLMHNDDIEAADKVDEWLAEPENRAASAAGDDRWPAWKWRTYTYHDGERLCIPSDNLMACLRDAGMKVVLKRQTTCKTITQTALMFTEPYIPLLSGGTIAWSAVAAIDGSFRSHANACRDLGFRLFLKRARVGNSKHVRVRPRFDSWCLQGAFRVTDAALTDKLLEDIWRVAGDYIGLCDWRPSSRKPGPFGRFDAQIRPTT